MKTTFFGLFLILVSACNAQITTDLYLQKNRVDLNHPFNLTIGKAKLIGFGALHGSSKTETTELLLLKNLIENHQLEYYLPETDYSTAHYFQKYIEAGDDNMLKELIIAYGKMVPQEKSIEVYRKWQQLRPLFKENKVQIIGIDKIASYHFSVKHVLSITTSADVWKQRDSLVSLIEDPSTNWNAFYETATGSQLKRFVEDYERNQSSYLEHIADTSQFNHIIKNIKYTYETNYREPIIYSNYLEMKRLYQLESSLHFAHFGVFHIMKSKINNGASFFVRLIENEIYEPSEILSIQGFLTNGSALWNTKYDKEGNYKGYSIRRGFGIGDYWLEYYYRIKELRQNKLSDITLFCLNQENTPYAVDDEFKLVKIKQLLSKSFWEPTAGKNTLDYIDYGILISDSKANVPIEEMK